jgi:outer membrane receptor protein involved in Fe transport
MRSIKLPRFLAALLVMTALAFPQEAQKKEQAKEKEKEKAKTEETEERSKLFQLDEIVIDVVEYIRDVEIPNMTVIKTELFPLSIGTTLDTALERQPGVDVQRIQEVGTAIDDDSIKIRGMGSRRIKVLEDGRLLNTSGVAGGYFIDWTMIPLFNVDRVEVIKGVGDPRYGNVLGGVVNLVPRKLPQQAPKTEVQLAGASFNTLSMNLYHGYKPGPLEYSLCLGANNSDGYLWNGDLRSWNGALHLGYDFRFGGRVWADITYSQIKKGFIVSNRAAKDPGDPGYLLSLDPSYPAADGEYMYGGMGAYPEAGSWWNKKKWALDFGYEQAIKDFGLLSLRYWKNHGDREAFNTRASMERIFHKIFFDDRSQGLSARYRHILSQQTMIAGVDFNDLKDDGDKNLPDDFRPPFRNGYYVAAKDLHVFLLDEIKLANGRWIITPGISYLSYKGISGPAGQAEGIPDIRMSGWSPSIKFTYNYKDSSLFYLSIARALRMPTPPEHFWHYDYDAGVDTSGLPFHEEDGLLIQGGWDAILPGQVNVEISPYYYKITNYIQFDLINFVSYNIANARIAGLSFEIARPFGPRWSAFFNYTYQKSQTDGDMFVSLFVNPAGRDFHEIPGLPAHKANLGVQYKTHANASIALFAQAVSSQKIIYNNNTLYETNQTVRRQDGYLRLDLELRFPIRSFLDVTAFFRNILNAHYQERYGFPAADRNVGVSFRTVF